jgi:ribosome recycling factor
VSPLIQLASISIPDSRTILISAWDASVSKDIEKALTLAQVGAQPINEGTSIRLSLPSLTQENRMGLVKLLKERTEKARVAVRGIRDDVRESIVSAHKNKELTDDDKFSQLKKLDEMTRECTDLIDEISAGKEKDIMSL